MVSKAISLKRTDPRQEKKAGTHTQFAKLPNVRLHTNPIVRVLPQKCQPELHILRMPVLDLDQPPEGDALKVFLRLLENEGRLGHGPALDQAWERHGAEGRQVQVVGGPQGKVAKELKVARRVGTELQIAGRHTVLGFAAEGFEV
jgi:hypothetical protein